ncbi:MAG: hypothetical protein IJU56_09780 [Clostridia bacterium]|nr:hypothetical protein [Clostridia bacterium]
MRKARNLLSILLSALLLALSISVLSTVSFAAESFSGTCGDNITWKCKHEI